MAFTKLTGLIAPNLVPIYAYRRWQLPKFNWIAGFTVVLKLCNFARAFLKSASIAFFVLFCLVVFFFKFNHQLIPF